MAKSNMALVLQYSCIKCINTIDKTSEKVILCGEWNCLNCMHHSCSSFKPTELKFLETNKNNIKWVCDVCLNKPQIATCDLSPVTTAINALSLKLDQCFDKLNTHNTKLDQHNLAIHKLEQQVLVDSQTNSIQTRSATKNKTTQDVVNSTHNKNSPTNSGCTSKKQDNYQDSDKKIEGFSDALKKPPPALKTPVVIECDEPKPAKNHRQRVKTLRGTRDDATLKTMDNKKWVFVSQFSSETTEEQVTNYLKQNNINFTDCVKLDITNKTVAAFKIAALEKHIDSLFDINLWPRNTIIRPYRRPFLRRTPVNLPIL